MGSGHKTFAKTDLSLEACHLRIDSQLKELERYAGLVKEFHEELVANAQKAKLANEELQLLRLSTTWRIIQLLGRVRQRAPRLFSLLRFCFSCVRNLRSMVRARRPRLDANSSAISIPQLAEIPKPCPADVQDNSSKNKSVRTPSERFGALIDRHWYLTRYPDVAAAGVEPIEHYIAVGADRGFDPNPLFDTDWYQARYPEASASGLNPLLHYITTGASLGWNPNPLFDTAWYLSTYPDVKASGLSPLEHYLRIGAPEGRDPSPLFDAKLYLASNPDVASEAHRALEHFLRCGASEARVCSDLFFPLHSTSSFLAAKSDLQALADLTNEQ